MENKLYRSKDKRMIWGICGGIAKRFDKDPTIIRVIAVATLFFGGGGILVYIILRFVVPLEPQEAANGGTADSG